VFQPTGLAALKGCSGIFVRDSTFFMNRNEKIELMSKKVKKKKIADDEKRCLSARLHET